MNYLNVALCLTMATTSSLCVVKKLKFISKVTTNMHFLVNNFVFPIILNIQVNSPHVVNSVANDKVISE